MLKTFFTKVESKARWAMGAFTLLIVAVLYAVFPLAKDFGMMGSGSAPHDPNTVYMSVQVAEATLQYPFSNINDCEKFRSEFLAKSINVTPCKLGSDLDAPK